MVFRIERSGDRNMSAFTAFILGFVLGISVIGLSFFLMYNGTGEDIEEEEEDDWR